jgi:hypothetical protein
LRFCHGWTILIRDSLKVRTERVAETSGATATNNTFGVTSFPILFQGRVFSSEAVVIRVDDQSCTATVLAVWYTIAVCEILFFSV